MLKYIIDENLPYHLKMWKSKEFIHVFDLKKSLSDKQIWNFAKENNLCIITKDTDFSNKVLIENPPPKVIHIKIGNLKINDFYYFLEKNWEEIIKISKSNKLTNVFIDRIEGIN